LFSIDLLRDAIVFGLLVGCFYAAVSVGLSVAFGLLDVPNIAHPAFLVLGSYCTYLLNGYGLDPIIAGIVLMPAFLLLGMAVYRFYYETFERRGTEAGLRGLAFFFGVVFIIEVGLVLLFGVDQRLVEADYIGKSLSIGDMRLPLRLFPLPIPVRTAAIVQAWHPRLDNDAAHQWLRRSIKTMCERVEDAHR